MNRDAIVEHVRALRERLAAEGVTHVAMFGSRSRGDARPDSDLDLVIDVEDGCAFSLLNLVGVQHIVGDGTGLTVNVAMRRSLKPPFLNEIAADIRDIY